MGSKKHMSNTLTFHPFRELKKIMKRNSMHVSCTPASTEGEAPLSDKALFDNAMRKVREIKEFRSLSVHKKRTVPSYRTGSPDDKALKVLEEIVAGKRPVELQDTQEYVEWVNRDYRSDIAIRLHEGKFSVQDTLDLHGIVAEEAETVVEGFLREAVVKGHRCIRIIHGRGLRSSNGPVLKNAVVTWLTGRYRKGIIAFVTARQCDGGLGALYVLLR